jgi:uncharacterized lipoprotein YajG
MRLKFIGLFFGVIILAGCKKDNKPTRLNVVVKSDTQAELSGVTIQLLSDEKRMTGSNVAEAQSSSTGQINFDVTASKNYYLYHDASDGKVLTNAEATYIVTGKFTSQLEINSFPGQTPAAKVGDDIHQDINGDGIISKYDMVLKVAVPAGETKTVNVTLK